MEKRDWKEKFPELAEAVDVAQEEGIVAASEERKEREKRIRERIVQFLSSSIHHYTFMVAGWSDGRLLYLSFSGRVVIGGKGFPLPEDLSRGVERVIKDFFVTLGVKTAFLRKDGKVVDWQDALNFAKEKKLGQPVICFSQTKPVEKSKHGRRK